MPQIKDRSGSGITERGIVSFDWTEPADVNALLQAAIFAVDLSSFSRLSKRVGDLAKKILAQASLPDDPNGLYEIVSAGKWVLARPSRSLKPASTPHFSLLELLVNLGYKPDSPEGYAAQALLLIDEAIELKRNRSFDEAMAKAFALGELVKEAGMKEVWEREALLGMKVHDGGRSGHESRYGTEEEKSARRAEYVRMFEQTIAKGMPKMAAYKAVAKHFGVSQKTIERATSASRS